jgi:hypothetical protein
VEAATAVAVRSVAHAVAVAVAIAALVEAIGLIIAHTTVVAVPTMGEVVVVVVVANPVRVAAAMPVTISVAAARG